MAWMRYAITLMTFSAALFVELSIGMGVSVGESLDKRISNSWQIAQAFRSPNRGVPQSAAGAAVRNGSCVAATRQKLTPFIPQNTLSLTVSDRPTFVGYVPSSNAISGELILMDLNDRLVSRTIFSLPPQAGILSVSLPASESPLKVGETYQWYLVLVCNSDDRSDNSFVSGWIERIQPDRILADRLKNAQPNELPGLYAESGIWQDALASSINLRRQMPDDSNVINNWEQLLKSVGLDAFSQEPLLVISY